MRAPTLSFGFSGGGLGACFLLLAALIACQLVGTRSSEAAVSAQGFTVSAKAENETSATLTGNTVVWTVSRSGSDGTDIEGKNVVTGQELNFPSEPGGQIRPSVSGRYAVWEDTTAGNSDIYGYDLTNPQAGKFPVAVGPEDQTRPSLSGRDVVWEDNRNGNRDVYSYNLTTRRERPVTTAPGDQRYPVIDHGTVAWEERDAIDSDVVAKDLTTGDQTTIASGPNWQDSPAVGGGTVLWREERNPGDYDVYGYDLAEGQELDAIGDGPGDQFAPAIGNRVATWVDDPGGNADIDGMDLSTGETFAVAQGGRPQENPAVSGDVVVWEAQRTGDDGFGTFDVFGAEMDLAPSAPAGLTARGTAAGVELDWTPSPNTDLAGYNVYRAASEGGDYTKLNTGGLLTEPSFEDAEAPKGARSFYEVTALDAAGTESAASRASAVAPRETDITLSASPSQVGSTGGQTTLSGQLTSGGDPLADSDLVLEQRSEGSTTWRPVPGAQPTTATNGNFSRAGVNVDRDTDYRAVFAGAEGYASSTSPLAQVDAQTTITVGASPKTVQLGRNVTFSGLVLPNKTGEVRLTIERGATTVRTTTAQLTNNRFTMVYKPNAAGNYRVTAAFGSGPDDADTATFSVRQ